MRASRSRVRGSCARCRLGPRHRHGHSAGLLGWMWRAESAARGRPRPACLRRWPRWRPSLLRMRSGLSCCCSAASSFFLLCWLLSLGHVWPSVWFCQVVGPVGVDGGVTGVLPSGCGSWTRFYPTPTSSGSCSSRSTFRTSLGRSRMSATRPSPRMVAPENSSEPRNHRPRLLMTV